MQVGAVLWTTVHSVQKFGVFLTIEGSSINGLLHVSNISRMHVDTPDVSSAFVPFYHDRPAVFCQLVLGVRV